MEKGGFNKLNFKSILIVAAILIVIISLVVFFFWPKDNSFTEEGIPQDIKINEWVDNCDLVNISISNVLCDKENLCNITIIKNSDVKIGGIILEFISEDSNISSSIQEDLPFSQEIIKQVDGSYNFNEIVITPYIQHENQDFVLYCSDSRIIYFS